MIEPQLQYKNTLIIRPISIGSGETLSESLNCGAVYLVGISFPSGWTTCDVTFKVDQVMSDALTKDLCTFTSTTSGPLTIPGTEQNQQYYLNANLFLACNFVQLSCSVAQAADAIVSLIFQPLTQGVHG